MRQHGGMPLPVGDKVGMPIEYTAAVVSFLTWFNLNPAWINIYSENTRVCAKWQWNTHRAFSLLSHTYCVQTEFRWRLPNEFDTRLRLFFNLQFVPLRCWILVNHAIYRDATWWRCGVRYCCYADTIVQHYDVKRFEYVLWLNTIHRWVMNLHYQTWIGRFINISRSPSKQMGVCDKWHIQQHDGMNYLSIPKLHRCSLGMD